MHHIRPGQSSDYSLRSIPSVEALLLLSEWYLQASQLITPTYGRDVDLLDKKESNALTSNYKTWLEDKLEPTKRTDRMCWVLLGTAQLLGHELGVSTVREHRDQDDSGPTSDHVRSLECKKYCASMSLRFL